MVNNTDLRDIVKGTPKGAEAIQKALVGAARDQEAMSKQSDHEHTLDCYRRYGDDRVELVCKQSNHPEKPDSSDNTQAEPVGDTDVTRKSELDGIDKILYEYEIGFVTHGKDVDEHLSKFKQAITAYTNKQIEEVLDNAKTAIVELYNLEEWQLTDVVNAVKAERSKLTQSTRFRVDKLKESK